MRVGAGAFRTVKRSEVTAILECSQNLTQVLDAKGVVETPLFVPLESHRDVIRTRQ